MNGNSCLGSVFPEICHRISTIGIARDSDVFLVGLFVAVFVGADMGDCFESSFVRYLVHSFVSDDGLPLFSHSSPFGVLAPYGYSTDSY